MIFVKHVSKQYGSTPVVDSVSFTVNKGEIMGLAGPNGAGKSTILKMIATVIKPTGGDILINGNSVIKYTSRVREVIGYVPQAVTLYESLSVLDNLKFWSGVAACTIPAARLKLIARVVGLHDRLNVKVHKLSGGMQRRLNMAVALLHDPDVLIMDEPTLGVDIKNKREIVGFIRRLAAEGKTVIYTSHDLHEIKLLCDRIVLLNQGRLMYEGALAEIEQQAGDSLNLEETFFHLGKWQVEL